MTGRERMKTVFEGRLPDRVPFLPTIYTHHACGACGRDFEEAITNPAVGAECMLGAALRYEADAVRFVMGPEASWYEQKLVEQRDGKLAQIDRASGKVDGYFDTQGGGALVPLAPPAPVRSADEARAIKVASSEEIVQQGCVKDVAAQVARAHEAGIFAIGLCSGQTLNFMVSKMAGADTALMSFFDAPDLALALIDKAVAISVERGKAFIDAGVDCLYIGDSYASASVISPDVYQRFCAPAYRELAEEFHRLGVYVYKHCCGNYDPLLDHLAEVGVDAMDGIDPDSGMSVRRTKESIGGDLTLMGGISCQTLLHGTPEMVYDEARQCVLDGKPGGRYVLGSACAVPRHTPPENLLAARAAAVEYGGY